MLTDDKRREIERDTQSWYRHHVTKDRLMDNIKLLLAEVDRLNKVSFLLCPECKSSELWAHCHHCGAEDINADDLIQDHNIMEAQDDPDKR